MYSVQYQKQRIHYHGGIQNKKIHVLKMSEHPSPHHWYNAAAG